MLTMTESACEVLPGFQMKQARTGGHLWTQIQSSKRTECYTLLLAFTIQAALKRTVPFHGAAAPAFTLHAQAFLRAWRACQHSVQHT